MTNIADLYPFLRCLLGDRQVMGAWHYAADDLLSGVRTCFALNRGPSGYALDGAVISATAMTPSIDSGDALALLLYETVLVMIGGEDGGKTIRTRELTIKDEGDRKRDLLIEMRQQVHTIRNGGCVFATTQSLVQFWIAGGVRWEDFTEFNLRTIPGPITI